MYNVELRSQRSQTNQSKRKEGCGLKYRVVSVLKDNRPRFLIISDIEEIEILPSKYLKHLDQINASPNTVKSAAFALSYYYNYLQEQTIGLDEITLLYGKYGMLRKSYLQEHRRAKYQILLLQGKLVEHLNQIDAEARDREEQLVKQMMEKQGITEKLKRQDNMEWTRRMNTICHDAEEMILTEMIYTKG